MNFDGEDGIIFGHFDVQRERLPTVETNERTERASVHRLSLKIS